MRRIWLALAERHEVRSLANWVLWRLIRFSAWPRAIERVVNVLGRAFCQRGDDIADVHAQRAGLNPGDDAALALPALAP
jgi:hypothetical protein